MDAPQKFRSKPVVMEAFQYTGKNRKEIQAWMGEGKFEEYSWDPVNMHIRSREGVTTAEPTAWICKDVEGGFYPCKDSIFRAKYEGVAEMTKKVA